MKFRIIEEETDLVTRGTESYNSIKENLTESREDLADLERREKSLKHNKTIHPVKDTITTAILGAGIAGSTGLHKLSKYERLNRFDKLPADKKAYLLKRMKKGAIISGGAILAAHAGKKAYDLYKDYKEKEDENNANNKMMGKMIYNNLK